MSPAIDTVRFEIARLDLRPSDTLVVRVPVEVMQNTEAQHHALVALRDAVAQLGCRVLMIANDIEVEVIRGHRDGGD